MKILRRLYIGLTILYFSYVLIYNLGSAIYVYGYNKGVRDAIEDVHSTLREHLEEENPDRTIKDRSEILDEI